MKKTFNLFKDHIILCDLFSLWRLVFLLVNIPDDGSVTLKDSTPSFFLWLKNGHFNVVLFFNTDFITSHTLLIFSKKNFQPDKFLDSCISDNSCNSCRRRKCGSLPFLEFNDQFQSCFVSG
ncbi:MAG: hypothetical protein IPN61_12420 [Bacteroidetes bacterium]|nr:hypothetical protein [Bacteroidota bacterium]